jgi:hypothetical protein
MRRLPKTHKKQPMKKGNEPDFYVLDKVKPLPALEDAPVPAVAATNMTMQAQAHTQMHQPRQASSYHTQSQSGPQHINIVTPPHPSTDLMQKSCIGRARLSSSYDTQPYSTPEYAMPQVDEYDMYPQMDHCHSFNHISMQVVPPPQSGGMVGFAGPQMQQNTSIRGIHGLSMRQPQSYRPAPPTMESVHSEQRHVSDFSPHTMQQPTVQPQHHTNDPQPLQRHALITHQHSDDYYNYQQQMKHMQRLQAQQQSIYHERGPPINGMHSSSPAQTMNIPQGDYIGVHRPQAQRPQC